MIFRHPPGYPLCAPAPAISMRACSTGWRRPDLDRHGDQIAPGAFGESIAALAAGQRRIPLLWEHRSAEQLGGIKTAAETDLGLRVQGQIVRGTQAAESGKVLRRPPRWASRFSAGSMAKPKPIEGGGTRYRKVDLVEVSAVATPSNRESRVLSIKSLAESSPAEFACLLRDGELPPMPRRLAEKVTRACLAAINETDPNEPTAEDLAATAAALDRLKFSFKRK